MPHTEQQNETPEEIREHISETITSIGDRAHAIKEEVVKAFDQTDRRVRLKFAKMKQTVSVRRMLSRHPWRMVLGAISAGVLLRAVLRPSERSRTPGPMATGRKEEVTRDLIKPPEQSPRSLIERIAGEGYEPHLQHLKFAAVSVGLDIFGEALRRLLSGGKRAFSPIKARASDATRSDREAGVVPKQIGT